MGHVFVVVRVAFDHRSEAHNRVVARLCKALGHEGEFKGARCIDFKDLRCTGLLKELDAYYLMMIEQPLGWDYLFGHVEIQKALQTPICLDECIHTYEQAEAAIALGACKIINIKLGRVGGFHEAKRIHDLCTMNRIPVWCGGMLESGVGRAHNIAVSTLPNYSLPGDVSASKRYWVEDVIEPEVTVTPQGTIQVPTGPGIGFAPRLDRIEKISVRTERLV